MNVQTVYNIAEAFKNNEKCNTRFITVCDFDSGKGVVARVREWQKIEDILKKTKFQYENKKLYCGTGAMEANEVGTDRRISLTDNMIGIASIIPNFDNNAQCRGCGACERHCPEGVSVRKIMKAIEKTNTDSLEKYGIEKCIGCGACSYYCKAGKNTMQIIQEILKKAK